MYVVTVGAGVSGLFLTVTVSIHKPISSRFDRDVSLQYRKFLQKVCEMYGERARGSTVTWLSPCPVFSFQMKSVPEFITGHLKHSRGLCCGKVFDSWMTGWAANMGYPGQSDCVHVALVPTKVSMSLGSPTSQAKLIKDLPRRRKNRKGVSMLC